MAIDNGHENVAMAIIKSDQWESALRSTSTSHGNSTTPLRKLIKRMPEVAEEVLNLCSITNATKDGRIRPDSKDYQVVFNYEFLEDFVDERKSYFSWFWNGMRGKGNEVTNSESSEALPTSSHYAKKVDVTEKFELAVSKKNCFTTSWGPVGFKKELHPLSIMVDNNCTDLLKHPLVKSLLNLKWRTYGRTAYFLNLFIFILFLTFLTAFALVSLNPQSSTCRAVFNGSFGAAMQDSTMYRNDTSGCVAVMVNMSNTANASGLFSGTEVCASNDSRISCGLSNERCGICEGQDFIRKGFLFITAAIVIAFALIRLIFELFQSFILKSYYFVEWENFIEIILFVCAIIFSFVFTTDCLCPTVWQWQIGCIAVFLAWIDFIIFVRELPLTGIYVLMLVHIFYTFMKMMFLTMLLLIAFSLAFYMAFYDPSEAFARASFATPGRAIVKTIIMTTGEFEYDSIFRQFPGGAGDDDITREIPFPPLSYILWIIFLIMMPILLTNLLVGLAVDDIKGIQDAAVLQRLALQVELALSVEELLPSGLRCYFIKRSNVVYPNRKLNTIEILRFNVFGTGEDRFDSSENISNALHPALTPIEQVQVQTDHLHTDVKHMKDAIHDLVERNIMMERLIRELVNKPAAEAYKSDDS